MQLTCLSLTGDVKLKSDILPFSLSNKGSVSKIGFTSYLWATTYFERYEENEKFWFERKCKKNEAPVKWNFKHF